MSALETLDVEAFTDYLARHEKKSLLRFLTCGSVDDGKSTLIGRLLYDTKLLFEDQLRSLERDSKKHGTVGEDIDFALLVDGLEAEREQGITIDVATASSPPTGASSSWPTPRPRAVHPQHGDRRVQLGPRRHPGRCPPRSAHADQAPLLHRLAARHPPRGAGGEQDRPRRLRPGRVRAIVDEYKAFAGGFGFETLVPIPLSARFGDNVMGQSPNMPWYQGPTLVEHLETVNVADDTLKKPFRMPVQW